MDLYIEVCENPRRRHCSLKVVPTPTTVAFRPETFSDLQTSYESRGWTVGSSERRSTVYVLELSPEARHSPKMKAQNPHLATSDPQVVCLYVGMTNLPVQERINNHLEGRKSCSLVRKYYTGGVFSAADNLFFHEAVYWEKEMAQQLRQKGYLVYQN